MFDETLFHKNFKIILGIPYKKYELSLGDNFKYTDPVDGTITAQQVKRVSNSIYKIIKFFFVSGSTNDF